MSTPQTRHQNAAWKKKSRPRSGLLEPEVLVEEIAAHVEDQVGREEAEGDLEEDVDQAPGATGNAVLERLADVGLERLVGLHRHGRELLAGEVAGSTPPEGGRGGELDLGIGQVAAEDGAGAGQVGLGQPQVGLGGPGGRRLALAPLLAGELAQGQAAGQEGLGGRPGPQQDQRADQAPARRPEAEQSRQRPGPQAWVNWRRIRDRQSRRLVSMRSVIRERILARSIARSWSIVCSRRLTASSRAVIGALIVASSQS